MPRIMHLPQAVGISCLLLVLFCTPAKADILSTGNTPVPFSYVPGGVRQWNICTKKIPDDIDYDAIGTLSKESREKLFKMRPTTIGQASRLGGVSPADVSNLLIHLETQKRAAAGAERPQTIKEKRKVRVRAGPLDLGHPSSVVHRPSCIVHHLLARCSPSTTPARSPGPRRRGHEGPGSARARTVDSN